jgi:hypothetical protein
LSDYMLHPPMHIACRSTGHDALSGLKPPRWPCQASHHCGHSPPSSSLCSRGFARHWLAHVVSEHMENSELVEARMSVCERSPVMPRPAVCWCRTCRRKLEHGRFLRLHDGSGRAQAEPWVRTCCQDMWLGLGWFCHWCGRSQDWGTGDNCPGHLQMA